MCYFGFQNSVARLIFVCLCRITRKFLVDKINKQSSFHNIIILYEIDKNVVLRNISQQPRFELFDYQ